MLQQYLKKFTIDILPSIVATIIGAYIVNYYIVPKAREATSASVPAIAVPPPIADTQSPGDGIAAVDDKAPVDKPGADKPVAEKPAAKPETATTVPTEPRKHAPAAREKAVVTKASEPSQADERRNVNDMARAAIERLRGPKTPEPPRVDAPRTQEAARAPEPRAEPPRVEPAPTPPRVEATASPAIPAALQPLPPAVTIATPKTENFEPRGNADAAGTSARPQEASRRPTPPADIPSKPLDLHADVDSPSRAAVIADDIVSATKSMFNSVIPR